MAAWQRLPAGAACAGQGAPCPQFLRLSTSRSVGLYNLCCGMYRGSGLFPCEEAGCYREGGTAARAFRNDCAHRSIPRSPPMPGLVTPKLGAHIPPDTGAQDPNTGRSHPFGSGARDPDSGVSFPPVPLSRCGPSPVPAPPWGAGAPARGAAAEAPVRVRGVQRVRGVSGLAAVQEAGGREGVYFCVLNL